MKTQVSHVTCAILSMCSAAFAASQSTMIPMQHVGPQPRPVDLKAYAHVIHVAVAGDRPSVSTALAAIADASAAKRYAILVAAGTYKESRVQMKPYVDLYGGFAPSGDWAARDVYANATILDANRAGTVVIGADNARLDGFVVTGGESKSHGAGIVCDGVSPTIENDIIVANHTVKPDAVREGLGKQIANEGAGIALLGGSRAYVGNNLICENTTEIGNGAGITVRGNVTAKILRNVFCNNTSGLKDNGMFHGKVGSRSSPGGAIAVSEASSPQISFNVITLGTALFKNDAGGIWVEGNSTPAINYNWIVGNTSYDDGGGIYVMGNLYYDAEGVRHDSSPDAPVAIEDNLIAGNDSVYGGPGGVRASRFGRIDLRRNRIVANGKGGAGAAEGAFLCVMEANTIADNGARRESATPSFRLSGDVTASKFDQRHYTTEVKTGKKFGKEDLSGSVVRLGKFWSVVKSSNDDTLTLWGRIAEPATKFEILDRYDGAQSASNMKVAG